MKAVFMGTPDFAVEALKALHAHHDVVCVYTRAPKPSGRGHRLTPSPVHRYAEEHGLPVRHPASLKSPEEQEAFKALNADVAVVAAYGLILPQACLEAFPHGCLNIHGSLLPRWRGAAPIQRALMAGDTETGITLMQMDAGLDTGDMLLKKKIALTPGMNAEELHDAMAAAGAEALIEGLALMAEGRLVPRRQPEEGVTYAAKITKDEGLIRWADETAAQIDCRIRALTPWPGAWFVRGGERISIVSAEPVSLDVPQSPGTVLEGGLVACRDGALKLNVLQRPGRRPLPFEEFVRGYPLPAGTVLDAHAAV